MRLSEWVPGFYSESKLSRDFIPKPDIQVRPLRVNTDQQCLQNHSSKNIVIESMENTTGR